MKLALWQRNIMLFTVALDQEVMNKNIYVIINKSIVDTLPNDPLVNIHTVCAGEVTA